MRIIGIDPGLQNTGWGIVQVDGPRLFHVANGTIKSDSKKPLSDRLTQLFDGLVAVIADYEPHYAAVEETFLNTNPQSTLKLGQARGIAMLVPARAGLSVAEYSPNHIKKAVVGKGKAQKEQVHAMVQYILPGVKINGPDASDALAIAICHSHHLQTTRKLSSAMLHEG